MRTVPLPFVLVPRDHSYPPAQRRQAPMGVDVCLCCGPSNRQGGPQGPGQLWPLELAGRAAGTRSIRKVTFALAGVRTAILHFTYTTKSLNRRQRADSTHWSHEDATGPWTFMSVGGGGGPSRLCPSVQGCRGGPPGKSKPAGAALLTL